MGVGHIGGDLIEYLKGMRTALKPYSWARYVIVAKSPCWVFNPAHKPPIQVVPSSKPFQVKACIKRKLVISFQSVCKAKAGHHSQAVEVIVSSPMLVRANA